MTVPELAPRSTFRGVIAVWIVSLVAAVLAAILLPTDEHAAGFALIVAASLVLSFALQLAGGRSKGFIERVAASVVGSLVIVGLVALAVVVVALATM